MSVRHPSRRSPPVGFARGGACAHVEADTIEAFALALRLGATGLESEVWFTADAHAVLSHDGFVGGRLRRRALRDVAAADVPPQVPRLADVLAACGTDHELLLHVRDEAAVAEAIASARDAGVEDRLWLAHDDWQLAATWRELSDGVHLVETTRLRAMKGGSERHVADVAAAGIDAIDLPHADWSGGMVALVHRFELDAIGRDARFERTMDDLLDTGVDAVSSDQVDLMMAAILRR